MDIETTSEVSPPRDPLVPQAREGREGRKAPKTKGDGTYKDDSGQWRYRTRVRLPRSGETKRISGTPSVNTRAAARALMEAEKNRAIEADKHPELALEKNRERWTLARLAEKVREHVLARQRPATVRHYRDAFAAVMRQVPEDTDITTITAGQILDIDTALRKQFAPATAGLYLAKFKAAMRLAVTWEVIPKAPAFPPIKRQKTEPRYLTDDEVDRLLRESPNDTFRAMVRLGLVTGLRRGELLALQWRDIQTDAEGRFVTLHLTRQVTLHGIAPLKSNTTRTIHVTATARAVLDDLWPDRAVPPASEWVFSGGDGGPVGIEAAKLWMAGAMDRAGISFESNANQERATEPRWHALRHTFAFRCMRGGMAITALQAILGHHDVRMTMIYARFAPSDVAAQMAAVFDAAR